MVLIGTSAFWLAPSQLAWLDMNVSYTYRHEVLTAEGEHHAVPNGFFRPYEDVFAMASFGYLVDREQIAGPYGVSTNRTAVEAAMGAGSLDELVALERLYGTNLHHSGRAEVHFDFLRRFFTHWNARLAQSPNPWRAPCQFCTGARPGERLPDSAVREVRIYEITTLYDGEHLKQVRREPLAVLRIPSPER